MNDAPDTVDPTSSGSQLGSTQDTSLTDIPPATPAEDSNIQPSISVSSQPKSPKAPLPMQSLPDQSPSATKLSRAREDDGEDEPLAKRAKVEDTADEVQVKPVPDSDRMDVDRPAAADGKQPKALSDPSLDSEPITQYQSREIRKILALVKKTRAGGNFKVSVEVGWPALWGRLPRRRSRSRWIFLRWKKKLRGGLPV